MLKRLSLAFFILSAVIFSAFAMAGTFGAGVWSGTSIRVTHADNLAAKGAWAGYPNSQSSSANCTPGTVWKYYQVTWNSGYPLNYGTMKFYTQTCY